MTPEDAAAMSLSEYAHIAAAVAIAILAWRHIVAIRDIGTLLDISEDLEDTVVLQHQRIAERCDRIAEMEKANDDLVIQRDVRDGEIRSLKAHIGGLGGEIDAMRAEIEMLRSGTRLDGEALFALKGVLEDAADLILDAREEVFGISDDDDEGDDDAPRTCTCPSCN